MTFAASTWPAAALSRPSRWQPVAGAAAAIGAWLACAVVALGCASVDAGATRGDALAAADEQVAADSVIAGNSTADTAEPDQTADQPDLGDLQDSDDALALGDLADSGVAQDAAALSDVSSTGDGDAVGSADLQQPPSDSGPADSTLGTLQDATADPGAVPDQTAPKFDDAQPAGDGGADAEAPPPADAEPPADLANSPGGDSVVAPEVDTAQPDAAVDAAADATADSGSPDAAADQPGPNVLIQLTSAMAAVSGTLTILAVPPDTVLGDIGTSGMGGQIGLTLWSAAVPALPASLWVKLPAGQWLVMAMVVQPGKSMPVAGGMVCAQGAPLVLQGAAAPQPVAMVLQDALVLSGSTSICKPKPVVQYVPTLTQQSFIQTPPTALGGAHFMNAHVYADRLWIAGSQDGYVSFDFPGGLPISSGSANWTVHGGPNCIRVARVGNVLFCSSRAGYLQILEMTAQQGTGQLFKKHLSPGGMVTEGMALQQGLLYVAAHKSGLAALQPAAPYASQPVVSPPGLTEAWDVAAIGKDFLVVANGGLGLTVLDVGGGKQGAPAVVGQLPLPGVAAYLAAEGSLVAVGALGGGLHLVEVSGGGQPQLRATLTLQANVYGVALVGPQVFAAVGEAVIVADVPAVGDPGPWRARASLAAHHFALDVDWHLGGLLTAEFQSVRRIGLNLLAPAAGPALVAPTHVASGVAPVGGKLTVTVPVHNAGSLPLHISSIDWFETKVAALQPFSLTGPWTIAPGATTNFALTLPKQVKGVLEHQLIIDSDDPNQPKHFIMQVESTWLQPGDQLPVMPTYKDGAGLSYNIPAYFKGKVGILLIGAQSCPVAFQALASASRDLAPLLGSGKVAALAINPWDGPSTPEVAAFDAPFPVVFSGLTTSDGHSWSAVLDEDLGQAPLVGPPMPIVYIVGKDGKLVMAKWGYTSAEVLAVLQQELAKP